MNIFAMKPRMYLNVVLPPLLLLITSQKCETEKAQANKAAIIAKAPAPAKVFSELAAPVEDADALLEEPEADLKAEEEPEAEEESELELPDEVEVPVDVLVVIDPLEDIVEVTAEAATKGKG
jgi:hypothetical protein